MRDNVERWLVHNDFAFKSIKSDENLFQIVIRPTGQYEIPVEIFEPKSQPGVVVVGTKTAMSTRQIKRYKEFTTDEKRRWGERVKDFCNSIHAINKNIFEDGIQKIGTYVVLDGEINQQALFDAIDSAVVMHEKTTIFLIKTF